MQTKYLLFLLILIMSITMVQSETSSSTINWASRRYVDLTFCMLGQDCNIANLIVENLLLTGNLTFIGSIMNITIINQNINGTLTVDGNLIVENLTANIINSPSILWENSSGQVKLKSRQLVNISVFDSGDVLSDELEAIFGEVYGAIGIGDVQLFVSEMFIGGLNLNGTFVTRNRDGDSNIKFAWVGANDKVRLAIPKEGAGFAMYNPRSSMTGGELGQAYDDGLINCTAQGYRFIDCAADITGADQGIQDDIEFWGSLYGGNGTWNVSDEGNIFTDGNITLKNRLKFTEDNHFISKGYTPFFGIAEEMIATVDLELHPEGEIITATIYAPNDNITDLIIGDCVQVGRNNSYSCRGNSQGIIRNDICQLDRFNNGTHCNMSAITDYTIMCNEFNKTEAFGTPCEFFADTIGRGGPLLWTQGDLEVWREANIMEGIRARLMADFIDTDVDVLNGSFHSQIPVNCNLGTPIGVERNLVNERFLGSLGVFNNLQIDPGNWHSKPDARCDSDECANANGISGSGNIIMQTNFSTLNFNQTGVSFVYSLTKMIAASTFTVTVNNNSGSGDVTLLTDSTDDVLLSSQYIAFPTGFDNVTKISLNFECDVSKLDRLCFVDTVIVNGTHMVNSTFSESRIASENCFDTGERGTDGRCIFGEYWDPCNQTLIIRGNITEVNIITASQTITGDLTVGGFIIGNGAKITSLNWSNMENSTLPPFCPLNTAINGLLPGSSNCINNWFTLDGLVPMQALAQMPFGVNTTNITSGDGILEVSTNINGSGYNATFDNFFGDIEGISDFLKNDTDIDVNNLNISRNLYGDDIRVWFEAGAVNII